LNIILIELSDLSEPIVSTVSLQKI